MNDPDKTKKIQTIRRSLTPEEIAAREAERLRHFEQQAEISRQRLREIGVAA